MFQKVETVDEWNLSFIPFDCHMLAVDVEDPTPAVTGVQSETRVVW